MLIKPSLLFIVASINLLIAMAVIARDRKKTANLAFFLHSLFVSFWAIGVGGFLLFNGHQSDLNWVKLYYASALGIGFSVYLFSQVFPDKKVNRTSGFLGLLFIGLLLPILFIDNFIVKEVLYDGSSKSVVLNTPVYVVYSVYLLVTFGLALTNIYKTSKIRQGIESQQARTFFWGYIIASLTGILFNLVLPFVGNYSLIWLGPLATVIYVFSVGYSIVKHRMFNIRLVVARSLAYAFSISIMLLAYAGSTYFLADSAFDNSNQQVKDISILILVIFASVSYSPIKKFFDRITNNIFYRDAYDPQTFLDQLNKTLVGNIETGILLRHTATVIEQNIKAACHIYVKQTDTTSARIMGTTKMTLSTRDTSLICEELTAIAEKVVVTDDLQDHYVTLKKVLEANDIAVISSLVTSYGDSREATAYLMLGSKHSGNSYSKQDIRIINIITDELLIAIQNALRFEEIQSFNITLQDRINDATSKLKRTNEKLKELDETKDEFISMASHQLRTPLTSVKGYLSMVLEGDAGKINENQRQLLSQAFTSSQRMVFLIADLLNVSRLKTGKFVINKSPTNLVSMVESEMAQLTEVARSHNLKLTFNKPDNFPILDLDETKTRQVIMNFVDNAIYYTPSGGHIKLELRTDRSSVYFLVKDNGLGVPKKDQSHLFGKFYRAKNAQKVRPDGTGLGLFMAKKIVSDQDGTILFESVEGKGSTFGFKFAKP